MNHYDFMREAQPGDVFRVTKYLIGRLYPNPPHDDETEGQEAMVLSKTSVGISWPREQVRLRVLSDGRLLTHDWTDIQHQAFELVRKGNGEVIPGVSYQYTEAELKEQRWDAFVLKVHAHDFRHQGYSNAATFLAILYLENERRFVDRLPNMRRQDGTVNLNKLEKAFRDLRLKVDDWAFQCPIDVPAEFAGRRIWALDGRVGVYWQEVADHFKEA